MLAGYHFSQKLRPVLNLVSSIEINLYGSLSLTGKGHHTDRAVVLGLMGNKPDTIKITSANQALAQTLQSNRLVLSGSQDIEFVSEKAIHFHTSNLPLHENGMTITAFDVDKHQLEFETYYSIGGGFVCTAEELEKGPAKSLTDVCYPFNSAEEMLQLAEVNGLSLAGLVLKNEESFQGRDLIAQKTDQIWKVMSLCMQRGFDTEGILDGGLNVTRRAPSLIKKLEANAAIVDDPMEILDWVNLFAFAVSEENAAGGQVVTSPTNGAAGVIPAVLMYYHKFIKPLDTKQLMDFVAVAGAIGILYKTNASISGAEVGCQGEVGVSSSMAAAGLTSLRGGSNEQICIAAEIAMEHSLGMTCDPIGGLVQIPCIERNAMGAMKAINASRMALKRTSKSLISLDKVIETMYLTGKDMNRKYRETSTGGLAIIHMSPPCE
jgi:L-serine dehydratase